MLVSCPPGVRVGIFLFQFPRLPSHLAAKRAYHPSDTIKTIPNPPTTPNVCRAVHHDGGFQHLDILRRVQIHLECCHYLVGVQSFFT